MAKKRYSSYDKIVNDFGNSAYEILKGRMVSVPDSVSAQLDEACYYLQRAQECKGQLELEGYTVSGARGTIVAHPLIKIQKEAMNMFYKLTAGMMLTPSTEDKARKADSTEDNRMIDSLING